MSSYANLTEDIAKSILLAYTPAGVIVDIKDTIAAAYNLYDDPHSDENKFDMILCMLGWIQGPGDALKIGFRGINKNPELLFDMARFILQKLGEHADAEAWLDGMLKDSKIRGAISGARLQTVQYIKDSDWILDDIIPLVESVFNMVESNLSSFIMLLANRVLYWKTKTPKTTQKHTEVSHVSAAQASQKTTYPNGKAATKPETSQSSGKKSGSKFSAIIKELANSDIGVVGEHMADYWVAKELALKVTHDDTKHDRKISRQGQLHKLSLTDVTGTGIDSVWQANNHKLGEHTTKAYAVIEAKCSGVKAGSTPAGLLNDNTPKPKAGKGTGPGKRGGTQEKVPKTEVNQQMSKEWVKKNLWKAGASEADGKYSRHLVFYGNANGDVKAHFEALVKNKLAPVASEHTAHAPSQVWGDKDIDAAINKRIERSKK
jgi:hypothetical protein